LKQLKTQLGLEKLEYYRRHSKETDPKVEEIRKVFRRIVPKVDERRPLLERAIKELKEEATVPEPEPEPEPEEEEAPTGPGSDNLLKTPEVIDDLNYSRKLQINDYELTHSKQFQNYIRSLMMGVTDVTNDLELKMKQHQEIVKRYMVKFPENNSPGLSPYRGVLLYHDMGTGKTLTGIHIAINFIEHYRLPLLKRMKEKGRLDYWKFNEGKAYLLFYKRLKPSWDMSLKRYLTEGYDLRDYFDKFVEIDKYTRENIVKRTGIVDDRGESDVEFKRRIFRQHFSHQNLKDFIATLFIRDHISIVTCDPTLSLERKLKEHIANHNLIIIDEVHNVISYIYSSINPEKKIHTKIGAVMYEWLMTSRDCKIVMLTGTPIVNNPNELLVMMNILKGRMGSHDRYWELFGLDPSIWSKMVFDDGRIVNPKLIQRRVQGLISRKVREVSDQYPKSFYDRLEAVSGGATVALGELLKLSIGNIRLVRIEMSDIQFQFYMEAKKAEAKSYLQAPTEDDEDSAHQSRSMGMCTFPLIKTTRYSLKQDEAEAQVKLFKKLSNADGNGISDVVSVDQFEGDFDLLRFDKSGRWYNFETGLGRYYKVALLREGKVEFSWEADNEREKAKQEMIAREILSWAESHPVTSAHHLKQESDVEAEWDEGEWDEGMEEGMEEGEGEEEEKEGGAGKDDEAPKKSVHPTFIKMCGLYGDQVKFIYDINDVAAYSPKMDHILRTVDNTRSDYIENQDLHFVYSSSIIYGVFHFEAYLRASGFELYLLKLPPQIDKQALQEKIDKEIKMLEDGVSNGRRFYIKYTTDYSDIVDGKRTDSSAGVSDQYRNDTIHHIFNHEKNKTGKLIKVLIGSAKAKEGLDLKNVRQVYILEPWWNMVKPEQAMGRAIRYQSHNAFTEPEDRYVKIDMLISTMSTQQLLEAQKQRMYTQTTDETVLQTALGKLKASRAVEELLNRSAIDCGMYAGVAGGGGGEDAVPCAYYFNQNETGKAFNINIESDLNDFEFQEHYHPKEIKYQLIDVEGRNYLKLLEGEYTSKAEDGSYYPYKDNVHIEFRYNDEIIAKKPELILYQQFQGSIILPALAYVSIKGKYVEIKYPHFRIK